MAVLACCIEMKHGLSHWGTVQGGGAEDHGPASALDPATALPGPVGTSREAKLQVWAQEQAQKEGPCDCAPHSRAVTPRHGWGWGEKAMVPGDQIWSRWQASP